MTYDPRPRRRKDLIRRAAAPHRYELTRRRLGEVPAMVVAAGMSEVSFPTGMSFGATHRPRCTFGAPFTRACSLPVAAAFERSHREG
jgi:hypothetical protein